MYYCVFIVVYAGYISNGTGFVVFQIHRLSSSFTFFLFPSFSLILCAVDSPYTRRWGNFTRNCGIQCWSMYLFIIFFLWKKNFEFPLWMKCYGFFLIEYLQNLWWFSSKLIQNIRSNSLKFFMNVERCTCVITRNISVFGFNLKRWAWHRLWWGEYMRFRLFVCLPFFQLMGLRRLFVYIEDYAATSSAHLHHITSRWRIPTFFPQTAVVMGR